MNKEFVPYNESLELKALGFDEPCFGKYLTSLQSNWKEYELILEMGMNEQFEDNRNTYILEKACSAPLYQQAFRWFREKYQASPSIHCMSEQGNSWRYHIPNEGGEQDFSTYEEAELACIRKLIEIVKQK